MKKSFLYIFYKLNKIIYKFFIKAPSFEVTKHKLNLIRLGSKYGGWVFVDDHALLSSTILSCGLGEDASFDIEYCLRFNARVVIVDPTPRAISHFNQILGRVGNSAEVTYTENGCIPISAYPLDQIDIKNLTLCPFALWNKKEKLRFYLPKNIAHVSCSIINFQNNYSQDTSYIEVDAITIDELLKSYDIDKISLIKLDIEGAEVEVLGDMLQKNIRPRQILVEYDELMVPSKVSKYRVESTHKKLLSNGYLLINRENTNFTYIDRHAFSVDQALEE
jgi:FkbM family methyltransferase